MVDNYGKIIVVGDYEGDLKAIVDCLNSLRWSFGYSDGAQREWAVEQDRGIIVLEGNLPCPSLRPMGHFVASKNGEHGFAADFADESFWKADCAHKWKECTLEQLSYLVSPHLTKGTIEFVAVHASRGLISHERLLIDADGHAEWHNCNSSDQFALSRWTRREAEHYPI